MCRVEYTLYQLRHCMESFVENSYRNSKYVYKKSLDIDQHNIFFQSQYGMGVFSGLLDLLFPPRCAFCNHILRGDERGMCRKCRGSISRTQNGGMRTGEFFSVCVSPLGYERSVRDAILRFKFHDVTAYAEVFGELMADTIRETLAGRYDLITWVPLSEKRLRGRGYDQAMTEVGAQAEGRAVRFNTVADALGRVVRRAEGRNAEVRERVFLAGDEDSQKIFDPRNGPGDMVGHSTGGKDRHIVVLYKGTQTADVVRVLMEFAATTRGCTGFDGGVEAGIAGGCAYHP